MTNALIDGDIILYRSCAAVETDARWDEDTHVLSSNAQEAFDLFELTLVKIMEKLGTGKVRLAFTKGTCFRSDIYPAYKQTRVNNRKPLCFAEVRARAEATYEAYSYPGLEADDVLGIWATRGDGVIVSEDKDLKTIPCRLLRQGEFSTITEAEADYWFMYQTLTGDTTDGYPGCPGIGPKKAEAILAFEYDGDWLPQAWPRVVAAYEKAGLDEDAAITQARLARILRASDWDAKKKEVILWQPPRTPK